MPGIQPLLEYKSGLTNGDADEVLFVPLRNFYFFYSGPDWREVIGDIFKAGVWTGVLLVLSPQRKSEVAEERIVPAS